MIHFELLGIFPDRAICYFFFQDQLQDKMSLALCAILHQLLSKTLKLIKHALSPYHRFGTGIVSNISFLNDILHHTVQNPAAGSIVVVLDALDECKNMDLISYSRLHMVHK